MGGIAGGGPDKDLATPNVIKGWRGRDVEGPVL